MDRVRLNVGGRIVETGVELLKSRSSFFRAMFDGPWKESRTRGEEGNEIFLDRDGETFCEILQLLRAPPRRHFLASKTLQSELEYFGFEFDCPEEPPVVVPPETSLDDMDLCAASWKKKDVFDEIKGEGEVRIDSNVSLFRVEGVGRVESVALCFRVVCRGVPLEWREDVLRGILLERLIVDLETRDSNGIPMDRQLQGGGISALALLQERPSPPSESLLAKLLDDCRYECRLELPVLRFPETPLGPPNDRWELKVKWSGEKPFHVSRPRLLIESAFDPRVEADSTETDLSITEKSNNGAIAASNSILYEWIKCQIDDLVRNDSTIEAQVSVPDNAFELIVTARQSETNGSDSFVRIRHVRLLRTANTPQSNYGKVHLIDSTERETLERMATRKQHPLLPVYSYTWPVGLQRSLTSLTVDLWGPALGVNLDCWWRIKRCVNA